MTFKVGGREFSDGTHVMGILNATADSFYAASRVTPGEAAERAARMAEEGAEIIDIGAQSTRPGADRVSALEEMSLLLPVLERVRAAVDVPISVDTFYPEVAEAALSVGADMINDVSCLASAGMAERVAEGGASLCIMHDRRGTGLAAAAAKALRAGIPRERILLDGGIGFNRGADEDVSLMRHYDLLSSVGYPLLLGASRKSFLGGDGRFIRARPRRKGKCHGDKRRPPQVRLTGGRRMI